MGGPGMTGGAPPESARRGESYEPPDGQSCKTKPIACRGAAWPSGRLWRRKILRLYGVATCATPVRNKANSQGSEARPDGTGTNGGFLDSRLRGNDVADGRSAKQSQFRWSVGPRVEYLVRNEANRRCRSAAKQTQFRGATRPRRAHIARNKANFRTAKRKVAIRTPMPYPAPVGVSLGTIGRVRPRSRIEFTLNG
jgi:hypothetical protein